ncbi:MAG: CopG family transcriptional regulator [Candidatus Hydrogenedentes bacterium]|nr:CopG family transcriptional regulator [Candidatus Hydrogenedentota bacterium]
MSKTVTLRLDDETYGLFRRFAEDDNRPLSNFIETAVKRYIEEVEYADEFEMAEIRANEPLNRSLRRGYQDAKRKQGRFVE